MTSLVSGINFAPIIGCNWKRKRLFYLFIFHIHDSIVHSCATQLAHFWRPWFTFWCFYIIHTDGPEVRLVHGNNGKVEIETKIKLNCSYNASQPATVLWKKGNDLLVSSDRISIESNNSTYQILSIYPSESGDRGFYTCFVNNSAGSNSSTQEIIIQSKYSAGLISSALVNGDVRSHPSTIYPKMGLAIEGLHGRGIFTYFRCDFSSCSESTETWHAYSFCAKKCPCFFFKQAEKIWTKWCKPPPPPPSKQCTTSILENWNTVHVCFCPVPQLEGEGGLSWTWHVWSLVSLLMEKSVGTVFSSQLA